MVYLILAIIYTLVIAADFNPRRNIRHFKNSGKAAICAYLGLLAVSFAVFVLSESGIYLTGPFKALQLFIKSLI